MVGVIAMSGLGIDPVDLIDPFAPAVSADSRVWEAAVKMGRVRRPCAVIFIRDPSGDMGLYLTARKVAEEVFELSEEGIVLVERGRISWGLDRRVVEISLKISMVLDTSGISGIVDGVYNSDCVEIVRGDQTPLGVVTEDSLIRVLLRAIPEDMRAEDIASKPIEIIDLDAPLIEAIGVMIQRGFRRLVITSQDRVAGVITMLDIIHRVSESHIRGDPEEILLGSSIGGIGYEGPLFIPENTWVRALAKKLLGTRSKCVLVGSPENPLGIVTEKDLIRIIRENI